MDKILIAFCTETGTTADVAEKIAEKIGNNNVEVVDVDDADIDKILEYNNIILGSSTTGAGDLPDSMDSFLPDFVENDLSGKTIAIFGLGDSDGFGDTFAGAMHHIHTQLSSTGCKLIGKVSVEGYSFDDSDAVEDDYFVGLAIDEVNEDDKTDERIDAWLKDILPQFN